MAGIRYGSRLTQYEDDNGDPLPNGFLYFYVSGTTTLQPTYNSPDLSEANPNPVPLDADGRQSVDVFLDDTLTYRVRLVNDALVQIAEDDPVAGTEVADAVADHNADTSAHFAATESQRGFIEIANHAELDTGTDPTRAVSAEGLQYRIDQILASGDFTAIETEAFQFAHDVNGARYIELGYIGGVARNTGIDFHSGATAVDYDTRIVASGGSGSNAGGTLNVQSATLQWNGGQIVAQIATGSLSTSGDTSISIPSGTWKKLVLDVQGVEAATDFQANLRFNGDTGSTCSYAGDVISQAGASVPIGSTGQNGFPLTGYILLADDGASQNPCDFRIEIHRPKSTTKHKSVIVDTAYHRASDASFQDVRFSGRWANNAAITAIGILLRGTLAVGVSGSTVNATQGTYILTGYL